MDANVAEGILQLRAGVDALLSCRLESLPSTEVTELLSSLEIERRRLESVDQRMIAEASDRCLAGDYARTSTADLLCSLLRLAPREARARVERARDLGPRRGLTGEPLEPIFPLAAAAARTGSISSAHIEVITHCVEQVPSEIAHEAAPVVERLLVDAALHCEPGLVARTGRELLARIDQDGVEPRDRDHARLRAFSVHEHADGSGRVKGTLTPEALAVWRAIIGALAAPSPGTDGVPDDRTADQRRHDGFLDAGHRLLRSATLPTSGGAPVTVLVTMTARQLAEQAGYATTGYGELISVAELLRVASEAEVIPVVLDDARGVLSFGRRARFASCGQRLALAARDHGCSFPACTRPSAWCEAHHVVPWHLGGSTELGNLTLLCGFHHREFERRGWIVRMCEGVAMWIPPPWLDPEQRPRRNTAHRLDDIEFPYAA